MSLRKFGRVSPRRLTNLRTLIVTHTRVTAAGEQRLKESLPKVGILHWRRQRIRNRRGRTWDRGGGT